MMLGKEFNNFFTQIVDSLDLYEFPSEPRREYSDDIVLKFKTDPKIVKIKKKY